MRILIIHTDLNLTDALRSELTSVGITRVGTSPASEGVAAALSDGFDVTVVDESSGCQSDGPTICRRLREAGVSIPVLVLSENGSVADRVRGLEAGADDYLVKPAAREELGARIRALVRRHLDYRSAVLRVGNLRFDTRDRTATVADSLLALTAREAEVLELFGYHVGGPLTQDFILERVWPAPHERASNVVEVYVGRLRRRLTAAHATVRIRTLKGQGYRLEATELLDRVGREAVA